MREQNGIYGYMDCNTAHIRKEDDDWLIEHGFETSSDVIFPERKEPPHLIVRDHEYGYWIHVPSDDEELTDLRKDDRIPQTIKALINKAKENDCYWINLDTDGHIHDDLEVFEW